jgi:hypothetical protein
MYIIGRTPFTRRAMDTHKVIREETALKRLLVFGCHEAWVYQLSDLDYDLDVVMGLPGPSSKTWDTRIRPVPRNATLISLDQARAMESRYHCIVAHNAKDLLDIKERPEPRILILHLPAEARIVEERARMTAEQARRILHRYVHLTGTHVVAVSSFKGRSWGMADDIVPFGVDPDEYPPCTAEFACGLRISDFIQRRQRFLLWDFHQKAFEGIPVAIIGHNPEMSEAAPCECWDHLKKMLSSYRFYIHTAHPALEDGCNMATLEAMAAGLPVLGNCHPSSPVQHGVTGFLSDDPREVLRFARLLLADRQLALDMGRKARKFVAERFSKAAFKEAFTRSIETARLKRRREVAAPVTEITTHTPPAMAPKPTIIDLAARSRAASSRVRKVVPR